MKIIISQKLQEDFKFDANPEDTSYEDMLDLQEDMDDSMRDELISIDPARLKDIQEDEDVTINEEADIEEPPDYPEFSTTFQAMRWAKHNNETVRINYKTLHGNILIRDIEPHGDFYAQTTHRRNIVVWDKTVGGIRTYILENIIKDDNFPKGYKFTGEKFSPKFNFSRERKNLKRRLRRRKNRKLRNKYI